VTEHPLTPENLEILREWVKITRPSRAIHRYIIDGRAVMDEIGVWVHHGTTSDAVFGPGWSVMRGIGRPWHFTQASDLVRAQACFFEWKLRLA
jgi:hypothetical protein